MAKEKEFGIRKEGVGHMGLTHAEGKKFAKDVTKSMKSKDNSAAAASKRTTSNGYMPRHEKSDDRMSTVKSMERHGKTAARKDLKAWGKSTKNAQRPDLKKFMTK